MNGQKSDYLRLHRIPTFPSKYLFFGQILITSLSVIAVLITTLYIVTKSGIILILIVYLTFLYREYCKEWKSAQKRFLLLNDKDEWFLSDADSMKTKLELESSVLVLPVILILYFRCEKRRFTFIYFKDNLSADLARILRVRLIHPVISKHPLKK